MKKSRIFAVIITASMLITSLTGCGIVKVIPKGTEAEYTGVKSFNALEEAAGDWQMILDDISANAEDLSSAEITSEPKPVKFEGEIKEYNTDTPKTFLIVSADGLDVTLPSGEKYASTNTSIRDCQTFKEFGTFTNQTEWSQYAKTLNAESYTNVIEPLGDLSSMIGSKISVIGCAVTEGDSIVVTPVSITVE